MALSKEDIQAIAQELAKQQSERTSAQTQARNNTTNKQPKARAGEKPTHFIKSLAPCGLILFWAIVFVTLWIKVLQYI